jgi:sulfite reductase alpha subunit-like flavoprotein
VLSVLLAFSRDGPIDQKKIYVQDIISQHAETIYDTLIRRNGCLFISGSSGKMPQGVKEAVIHVIEAQEGISREQAQATHTKLETEGRWKQETW